MFTIVIQEKGGEQRRMVFNKSEITIGRVQGNDIVLPKGNVSKRHARIVLKDSKFIIVDLKSTNGTYVNGRKIASPLVVKDSDKIYIGDFIVGVDENTNGEQPSDVPMDLGAPSPEAQAAAQSSGRINRPTEAVVVPPAALDPVASPLPRGAPPRPPGASGPSLAITGPNMERASERVGAGPVVSPLRSPPTRQPLPGPTGQSSSSNMPTMPPPPLAPPPIAPSALATEAAVGSLMPAPMNTVASGPPVSALPPALSSVAPMAANASYASLPVPVRRAPTHARRVNARPVPPALNRGVVVAPLDAKQLKMLDLQTVILDRVRSKLDLDKLPVERLSEEEMWQRAERVIVEMVQSLEASGEVPKYIEHDLLIKETINEALGLGLLEDLLADDTVDEIIVDRRDRIIIGKDGQLRGAGKAFSSDDVLLRVIERLVAPSGIVLAQHPMIDVRLRDGSRLTAAVPPIATRGPCLVLKKPMSRSITLQELTAVGALSAPMAEFLNTAIKARRNVLVCGGPSSGKTAVMAALAHASPTGERIVTVEQVSELALARDEWVSLECRAADGRSSAVGMTELIHKAVRLAPDRLIIGEVIGAEAFEIATTLGATIDGAVAAVSAEGASSALNRLATLVRAGSSMPEEVARDLVTSAFEVVVHVGRAIDGRIRVVSIDEVIPGNDALECANLFAHRDGQYVASGHRARFIDN
jgi:pilus assembly protein CpaF